MMPSDLPAANYSVRAYNAGCEWMEMFQLMTAADMATPRPEGHGAPGIVAVIVAATNYAMSKRYL
jgi:hypothetical protein